MKIKYTIHNYNCPICGYTIKQENELLYILISMCLFPFTLLYCITLPVWSLVKNTINKKVFFDLDIKKIGDKVKKCPVCKREVCIKIGTEWIELSINEMKIWAYRTLYRIIMGFTYCAFLMLVVNIVFFQAWFSTYGDKIFAMTLFFILLALIIVILVLCFCWKKLYNKEYILLNKKDFSKVQQSLNRLFSDSENFYPLIKIIGKTRSFISIQVNLGDYSNCLNSLKFSKSLYLIGSISASEYMKRRNEAFNMIRENSKNKL